MNIYLHVGFGDLINKTKGDTIVDMYKQPIYKLLETSEVKICMSLMEPVQGYPETNSKLKQINRCVRCLRLYFPGAKPAQIQKQNLHQQQ